MSRTSLWEPAPRVVEDLTPAETANPMILNFDSALNRIIQELQERMTEEDRRNCVAKLLETASVREAEAEISGILDVLASHRF